MKGIKNVFVLLAAIMIMTLLSSATSAMPNFARKYNLGCGTCHDPIPRLTEFGFRFRAAGFRMPDEIGKDQTSSKMTDYLAARTQSTYNYSNVVAPNGSTTVTNQFSFLEFTGYPITGAFGKNIGSLVELSILPDNFVEVENAYVKLSFGEETKFFTARAGIFHPFEGYGASDRPISISRPLFQTTPASYNQSTQFKPWGYDEAGIELGYSINDTYIRATMFGGILGEGEPNQGGNLSRSKTDPSYNSKDFQITATQILTDNGGGVTGYFYTGNVDLPTNLSGATDPKLFQNSFSRYALYASYPINDALILGGYQKGQDDSFNTLLKSKGDSFNSNGFFGEVDYKVQEPLWLGVRYAEFTPAENVSDNKIAAVTGTVNYSFDNGLQLIGEYNHKTQDKGIGLTQKTDSFQIRLIYIY